MKTINVKVIDRDVVEILKEKYYKESYLKDMMKREYDRGLKDSRNIYVAEVQMINQREN